MLKKFLKSALYRTNKLYDAAHMWKLREKAEHGNILSRIISRRKYEKGLLLNGASIPLKVKFDSAPVFPHGLNGIFISSGAKIGSGCTIFHQVTIGSNTLPNTKNPGAPTVGDNVYIGAGAKLIGGIHIGNNVRIGANCIVVCDIPDNSTVVLPSPKVIVHDTPKDNTFLGWNDFKTTDNG